MPWSWPLESLSVLPFPVATSRSTFACLRGWLFLQVAGKRAAEAEKERIEESIQLCRLLLPWLEALMPCLHLKASQNSVVLFSCFVSCDLTWLFVTIQRNKSNQNKTKEINPRGTLKTNYYTLM